jgi:type I restriction enzyme M protein
LFQTNQDAFVKTKRRLLDTCDLWCVLSLPGGVFTATGAGVKTSVLFFTKGRPTEKIWYFDLSDVKVAKKTPFTREQLNQFFELLPSRAESDRSWVIDISARRRKAKEEADVIRATATEPRSRLKKHQESLDQLKKIKASAEEQEAAKVLIKDLEREVRDIESRAQSIENAAFDLKAVNPNVKSNEDLRTPAQLLEIIRNKGFEVQELVRKLGEIG